MKFLIIDDHRLFREGLLKVLKLERRGLKCQEAGSLKQGLELAKKEGDFDLILLDVLLPDAQGLQGLKSFLKLDPRPKVLLVTAVEDETLKSRALALGAAGVLS